MPTILKKILFYLIVSLFTIVLSLIFGEIILRAFWSGNLSSASYVEITVKNEQLGYRFIPGSSKTIFGQMNDYATFIKINSHGFRGKDREYNKAPNIERILLLGDSEAFGQGVTESDMLDVAMEKLLNSNGIMKYEVINLAMPGIGTLAQEQLLIKDGLEYNPDKVIILVTSNDLFDNIQYMEEQNKLTSNKSKNGKTKVNIPKKMKRDINIRFDYLYNFTKWQLRPYFLKYSLLRKAVLIFYKPSDSTDLPILIDQWYTNEGIEKGLPLLKQSLSRINSIGKFNNIDIYIAFIPSLPQLNKNYEDIMKAITPQNLLEEYEKDPKRPQRIIMDICLDYSLNYIEILDTLKTISTNSKTLLKHVRDGHLNERGTLEIAKILSKAIQENRGLHQKKLGGS